MTKNITLPTATFQTTKGEMNLLERATPYLLLYFYPKDSTPGCTTQALDFSHLLDQFAALGVQIIGVSRDSIKSHQNFCTKQALSIELLSDTNEVLCRHFDVIKPKNMYGKTVFGIERSTFIFKGDQLIYSQRKVKAAGHAESVLQYLQAHLVPKNQ